MKEILLSGKWKMYYFKQGRYAINHPDDLLGLTCIDCTVPGNAELDLCANGILPKDLYMGENIRQTEQYEEYEWWYKTEFTCDNSFLSGNTILHFEGVDCFAEYWLNGKKIGQSENMFIPVEFDVSENLQSNNSLVIRIRSAILESFDMEYTSNETYISWGINQHSIHIRKAPHSFGWDIFPRAVSAGIWKDVNLINKDEYEITDISYCTRTIQGNHAELRFAYDTSLKAEIIKKDAEIEIAGVCGKDKFIKKEKIYFKAGYMDIKVKNPQLWWPYGYGDSNIYKTTVNIYCAGKLITSKNINIGIRTVDLVHTDTTDGKNGSFKFVINGIDIMCKGTNWVPLDAFHSRELQRYDKALPLLKDIGCNIIRCWGGNVYPEECLYDFCDENGIMIWQDFSMACHSYPQTDEFYDIIRKEVKSVVKKYKNHPSLILWAGDNECDQVYYASGVNPSANRITREIIPQVILQNDFCRPYLPSSPYISQMVYGTKDLSIMPEDHLWGPRDYFKSRYYSESKAHFVSETGYFGCPSKQSLEKFIDKEYLWPYKNNSQWILHSSDSKGNDYRIIQMSKQIKQLFGEIPDNLEQYIFASQVSQAEAKKYFIERVRCAKPVKSGVIWWNLLDGWPQFSDAVVDYYYDKKLAYDYIKRSQQPFAIIVDEIENWALKVIASNDTLKHINGNYKITDAESGNVLLEGEFSVSENANKQLGLIPVMYSDKGMLLIEWSIDSKRYINHYLYGMPPFSLNQYSKWLSLLQ